MLRQEDCEVARTAEELITWIESVHSQFDKTRNYAWIEECLVKPFYEEIVPLGYLARHKYLGRPGLYLRPKIGNQNYDAEIIDRSSGMEHIARVEFTSTYRGYDLSLRMEHLATHGATPMSGPVWRDGTKASGGQVQVQQSDFAAVYSERRRKGLVTSIEARMADKLGKTYEPGTIIAIVIDDFDPQTDIPQLTPYFRDTLRKQALDKFCGVFIIGASGKTFLEYGETDPIHSS